MVQGVSFYDESVDDQRPEAPVNCPRCGKAAEVQKGSETGTWWMRCSDCGQANAVKRSALGIFYTDESVCSH
jgi:transcription elongation factor Elf1